MATAIKFEGVRKRFGAKQALDGVAFEVKQGEIFGFLGPNGAGKSTSIRCLMDFIRPDSGSVAVLGLDSQKDSTELKRQIGYLPADTAFYDGWTGQEHIEFAAKLRGVKPDFAVAKTLGFELGAKVGHLSTGNKQKLGIILSLLGKPKLLIMDEPTRGLDPLLQNQFYTIIRDYREGGGTVFMSSHNLSEVEKVCDSIAVIRAGKLAVEETLDDIKRKSVHHIDVTFAGAVDPKVFRLEGVTVLSGMPPTLNLRVSGDINPVMHIIGKHNLKDIEITRATLEEIFMEQYQ